MRTHLTTLAVIALFSAGCSTTRMIPYSGQNNWPVSTGVLVENVDGVPVYYGSPNKPFTVMGRVVPSQNVNSVKPSLRNAILEAKAQGADGIVLPGAAMIGSSINSGDGGIWLIKYKPLTAEFLPYPEPQRVWSAEKDKLPRDRGNSEWKDGVLVFDGSVPDKEFKLLGQVAISRDPAAFRASVDLVVSEAKRRGAGAVILSYPGSPLVDTPDAPFRTAWLVSIL